MATMLPKIGRPATNALADRYKYFRRISKI